jgi:hypothetical protein
MILTSFFYCKFSIHIVLWNKRGGIKYENNR